MQGAFASLTGILIGPFAAAWGIIAAILKRISDAVGGIKGVASGITSVGKQLKIPGFTSGVENFRGGLAIVGERGPELVGLPRGSNVYSNEDSREMIGGGSSINLSVQVGMYAGEPGELRTIAERIYRELMRIDRANGTPVLPNIGVRV